MFYFLLVSYNIQDMTLDNSSYLSGPYQTPEARDKKLASELASCGVNSEAIVNVTKLMIEDGKLVKEESFLADEEGQEDQVEEDQEDQIEV